MRARATNYPRALGFVGAVLFSLGPGRAKEVKPLAWVLGMRFFAHLIWKGTAAVADAVRRRRRVILP